MKTGIKILTFLLTLLFQNVQSCAPVTKIGKLFIGGGTGVFLFYQLYRNRLPNEQPNFSNELKNKNKEKFEHLCKFYPTFLSVNSDDPLGINSEKSPFVVAANIQHFTECMNKKSEYRLNQDDTKKEEDVIECMKEFKSRFD